jgi:CRP-like cAMP-binding protein
MTAAAHPPADLQMNQLLAALAPAQRERWLPHLEPVALEQGQVLCEAGCMPPWVIFPTTAIVSLSCLTQDGASAEFAVVGNDGVVGIGVFMGGNTTPGRAVVQCAGQGLRLSAQVLRATVEQSGPVLALLLRYTQALIVQMAQTAACNRHHAIDQQLCRRLLMGLDRSLSNELAMTQEALANLLGVRREGITAAAIGLQRAGVIRYRRGHIEVLDRPRLERRSCECYAVAHREYRRLIPLPLAA